MALKPIDPGPNATPSEKERYDNELMDAMEFPEKWGDAREHRPSAFTRAVFHAKRNPKMWLEGTVDVNQFGPAIDADLVMNDAGIKPLADKELKRKELDTSRSSGAADGPGSVVAPPLPKAPSQKATG